MNRKLFLITAVMFFFVNSAHANECINTTSRIDTNILGIQIFYPEEEQSWVLIKELGIKWVRIEFRWDILQPNQDIYNWESSEKIISYANKYNINIMGLINHIPNWAQKNPIKLPKLSADFTSILMDKYAQKKNKTGIKYWEIYNEPNLPGYGWPDLKNSVQNNIRLYKEILIETNKAIRKNHSQVILISAGLSPDGQPPEIFLKALNEKSMQSCFDIIGFHPYGKEGLLEKTIEEIKAYSNTIKDKSKPVWFTEYGTDRNSDRRRLILSTFKEVQSLEALFWFSERDIHIWNNTYGLVTYYYAKKPEFWLFKNELQNLKDKH